MPKKKTVKKASSAAQRIVLRTGEALVEGGPDALCAEPEVVIGELDGPVGSAIANLMGNQVQGHTKVFAILDCGVQVRPTTVMVSKVTVQSSRYTNILMGSVQAGIANGVLDAVRSGAIPKAKANDLGIIVSVWLDPSILKEETIDYQQLFDNHRQAVATALQKAMNHEPGIDWLLKNQDKVTHVYHKMALDGDL